MTYQRFDLDNSSLGEWSQPDVHPPEELDHIDVQIDMAVRGFPADQLHIICGL